MLTEHQQEIQDAAIDILAGNKRLLIKGSAGVGKTYLMQSLLEALKQLPQHKGRFSLCSAPTNKAVEVLRGKVGEIIGNQFVTVHSALKLKRKVNPATGAISFPPDYSDKRPPLKNVSLMVVDEASMLNKELLGYLENHAKQNNTTIIFVGDEKQLPPVGEKVSPVFVSGYPELELTEIVRQAEGNPIIQLSRNMSMLNMRMENRTDIGGYIYTQDKQRIIETLAAVNGTDELKYLAWTNYDVDAVNSAVRRKIYGNPAKIELGETLVFNAPYGEDYYTNQEIKVEKLEKRVSTFPVYRVPNPDYTLDNLDVPEYLSLQVSLECYVINGCILVVHENSEKAYNDALKSMKLLCTRRILNWQEYYNFVEIFADLKYNHALTVHKSQGSTFRQAIINVKDLNKNKDRDEKAKLFYTAITRASQLLILYV